MIHSYNIFQMTEVRGMHCSAHIPLQSWGSCISLAGSPLPYYFRKPFKNLNSMWFSAKINQTLHGKTGKLF